MSNQLRKSTIEKWSPYVEEFERSSLSLTEFCIQEGISAQTFSKVRRRILYEVQVAATNEPVQIPIEADHSVFKQAYVVDAPVAAPKMIHIRINGLDMAYPSTISKADLTLLLSACVQAC